MDFVPTTTQALVLWKLLFTGEQPAQSKMKPKLEPKPRQALVDAGLLAIERRGRAKHLVPTERAWDWAQRHLDAALPRSPEAAPVLRAVLTRLKTYLDRQEMPLAELFVGGADVPREAEVPLASRIRAAYLEESGGALNVRVRLASLRGRLVDVRREEVDELLRTMQNAGELVLMTLDNPGERHPTDEAAALDVVGEQRHIAYLVR